MLCYRNWLTDFASSLFALNGLVVADRTLQSTYSAKLRGTFQKSFEENFSEPDGSIVPIRSSIIGFAVCFLTPAEAQVNPF
jgi:hypothetical protein